MIDSDLISGSIRYEDFDIMLVTIPGTGTHFFRDLLKAHGFEVRDYHCDYVGMIRLGYAFENNPENSFKIVTTVRELKKIKNTWEQRNFFNQPFLNWDRYFQNWYSLQQYNPVIVSVDMDRESRLNQLSHILKTDLKTDWTPVNETAKAKMWNVY